VCSIYSFCWKLKTNQIYHTTVLLTNYISITINILDIHTQLYIYTYTIIYIHSRLFTTFFSFASVNISHQFQINAERRTVSFYNLIKLQLIKKYNMHASLYSSIPLKIRTFLRLMIHPKLPNITNSMLNINK